VCTACAAIANTTVIGAISSTQCYCPTGYYGSPAASPGCSPCAPGGFEGTTAGPSTLVTTVNFCICSKNFYVSLACRLLSRRSRAYAICLAIRSAEMNGWLTPHPASHKLCSHDSAVPPRLQVGASACLACPINAVTLAVGSSAITACGCPAGYFGKGSDATIGCGPCPSIATPYVTGISFDDTSNKLYACVCPANYYFGITAGTPPVGKCNACPSGAITQGPGATDATQCGCADNFWGNPATGGAGCLACPRNSVRPGFNTADTTSAGCTCDRGYWCAAPDPAAHPVGASLACLWPPMHASSRLAQYCAR
jgi:hypothetical protein